MKGSQGDGTRRIIEKSTRAAIPATERESGRAPQYTTRKKGDLNFWEEGEETKTVHLKTSAVKNHPIAGSNRIGGGQAVGHKMEGRRHS